MESEIEFELKHDGGKGGICTYEQVNPKNNMEIASVLYLSNKTLDKTPPKISITINIPK